MRIIGLDVGTKTVGVALSDPLGITAQPFETITRKENNKLRRTYARIEQIISEYDVTEIVVGYPKNMDDTIGERAKACEELQQHWRDEQDYLLHCGMKDLLQLKQTKSLKNAG